MTLFSHRSALAVLLAIASAFVAPRIKADDLVGTLPVDVSVDNKGAANASIPLQIPAGRGGMQPKLSLNYNSQGGNGPLGIGFALSTGFPQTIARGRSILARDGETRGVTFTATDKFYLDGKRLIYINGGTGYGTPGSTYRTEVDSFVTITATGAGSNIESFTVTDKSGTVMTFGKYATTVDGYQTALNDSLAYTYAIKRVIDPVGNYVEFNYADVGNGEHVLAKLTYTGNSVQNIDPQVEINFSYNTGTVAGSSSRRDASTSYIALRRFSQTRRLDRISITSPAASTTAAIYDIGYEYAPNQGRTRLKTVATELRDSVSGTMRSTPSITVDWSNTNISYTTTAPVTNPPIEPGYVDISMPDHYAFGDVDGDGKDDYVWFGGNLSVQLSTGTGFGAPTNWFNQSLTGNTWKLADVNGDGKKDIIFGDFSGAGFVLYCLVSTGTSFVPLNGGGNPTEIYFGIGDFDASWGIVTNRIAVADFTGDGRDDVLLHRKDGQVKLLANQGESFSAAVFNIGGQAQRNEFIFAFWAGSGTGWGYYRQLSVGVTMMPCELNGDGITDYAWTETIGGYQDSGHYSDGTIPPPWGGYTPLYASTTKSLYAVTSLPGGGFSQKTLIANDTWELNEFRANGGWFYRENSFVVMPSDTNGDGLTDFTVLYKDYTEPVSGHPDYIQYYLKHAIWLSRGSADAPQFEFTLPLGDGVTGAQAFWNVTVNGEQVRPWFDKTSFSVFLSDFTLPYLASASSDKRAKAGVIGTSAGDGIAMCDVNIDGREDFVWYVVSSSNAGWWVMYSTANGYSQPEPAPLGWLAPSQPEAGWAAISLSTRISLDLNGDGVKDYAYAHHDVAYSPNVLGFHISAAPSGDRVVAINNGLGQSSTIAYAPITNSTVYTPGAPVSYPIQEVRRPQYVVSDLYRDSGGTTPAHYSYQYSGRRTDLSGRGDLGFHSFVTLDHQTNLFKYQFLTQSFPMTGLTAREQTYRLWESGSDVNFRLISSHDNTVVFDEVVNGANTSQVYGTVYPFMSKAIESRWENSGSPHFTFTKAGSATTKSELLFPAARPAGAHITISAQSWFDNQPLGSSPPTTLPGPYNASDRTTDWAFTGANSVTGIANYAVFDALTFPRQITYGNLRQLQTDFGDGFTEKVVTDYLAPTTNGLTGRVDSVTTTGTSATHGTESAPIKRYTYATIGSIPTPLVATEAIDATDNALDLTTSYTRDSLGRVTTTTFSGFNSPGDPRHIGTYIASTIEAYDPRFDLPTISKNAYGHPTTVAYHPFFAQPTSATDANGAETTTQYDALGRTIQARDEFKNLQSNTAYDWDTSVAVSPPSGVTGLTLTSAYRAQTTTTVKPTVTAYYDRLGRPIRTIKEGFAGQQTVTDTIYNTLGQVVATSLPYKSGTTPLWATTTYDALGRVVTLTAPNGTVTTNAYQGRITQVTVDATDREPQTNATYVDAKGRTIAVWNADNAPATSLISGSDAAYSAPVSSASIEFRLDGFGRMRETRLRDQAQLISATYDAFGRQTSLNDPDKGNWTYVNNALGQVVSQTDAKGNATASTFDRLGRPLTRTTTEPNSGPVETANWYYYDTAANVVQFPHLVAKGDQGWIGAPQREEAQTTGAPGYAAPLTRKAYYYDLKGRPAITLNTVDGKWFYTHTDYDNYSRPVATRHYWRPAAHELPSDQPYVWQNFGYTYTYNAQSYLLSMGDTAGRTWWQADPSTGYDYLDRPVLVRKGSGHWTKRNYRASDGLLDSINTGNNTVQFLTFDYDGLGNLVNREDQLHELSEVYSYDSLNRVTHRDWAQIVAYQTNGNIEWKKDVLGNTSAPYQYSTAKPHAATAAFGYAMNYDANGNLLTRTGNNTTWSTRWAGFDKPRWLAKTTAGTTTGSEFTYDANRSRVLHLEFDALDGNGAPAHYTRKKVYGLGPTLEVDYKNTATSGAPAWQMDKVRIYVPGPEGTAGTMEYSPFAPSDQDERPLVYHYDHLGSIETITPYGSTATSPALDDAGRPSRFAYDAWGERRNAATWTGAPVNTSHGGHDGLTPRGYTGHEMLDGLDLVHMNGRIYDPLLGRFLSADPTIPYPSDLQSYNRYSYCRNNPLSRVDKTGFADTPVTDEFDTVVQPLVNRQNAWANDPMHPVNNFGRAVVENSTIDISQRLEGEKVDAKLKVTVPVNNLKETSVTGSVEAKNVEAEGTVSKKSASGNVTYTLPAGATVTIVDGKTTLTQGPKSESAPQSAPTAEKRSGGIGSVMTAVRDVLKNVLSSVSPPSANTINVTSNVAVTVGDKPAVAVTVGNTTVKASTDLNKAQETMKKDEGSLAAEMQKQKEEEERKKK